eukprot:9199171-Lingulodinium_polyedra.AAC.1
MAIPMAKFLWSSKWPCTCPSTLWSYGAILNSRPLGASGAPANFKQQPSSAQSACGWQSNAAFQQPPRA